MTNNEESQVISVQKSASASTIFVAGAVSGLAEALSVQPFDMIKTRHHLNQERHETILETMKQVYREGGFLRFYRGMAAELVGMVPKSSAMYGSYEITRKYLSDTRNYGDTSLVASVAGFVSGVPEALTVQPFQVVKVRLQAKEHLGRYNGPLDCIKQILQKEGVSAFSIGIGPTLWRNCVWNTVYFGTMHKLKTFLPEPKSDSHFIKSIYTLVTGAAGAIFATCFNCPFDVVKSRFQSQLHVPGEPIKYKTTLQSLGLIYQEEGFFAIYKGFKPKAVRMALGGGVAMLVFEIIIKF